VHCDDADRDAGASHLPLDQTRKGWLPQGALQSLWLHVKGRRKLCAQCRWVEEEALAQSFKSVEAGNG